MFPAGFAIGCWTRGNPPPRVTSPHRRETPPPRQHEPNFQSNGALLICIMHHSEARKGILPLKADFPPHYICKLTARIGGSSCFHIGFSAYANRFLTIQISLYPRANAPIFSTKKSKSQLFLSHTPSDAFLLVTSCLYHVSPGSSNQGEVGIS